jgi:hypothetical protein
MPCPLRPALLQSAWRGRVRIDPIVDVVADSGLLLEHLDQVERIGRCEDPVAGCHQDRWPAVARKYRDRHSLHVRYRGQRCEGMMGAAGPSDIDVDGRRNRAAHLPPGWLIAQFAREGGIGQGQGGGQTSQTIVFHVKAELRDGEDWDHFFNQRMTINGLAAGRSK